MTRQSKSARPIFAAAGTLSTAIRRGDGPEQIANLRRELRAAQLEKYVRDAAAAFPPLTDEQRERVVAVLRSAPTGEAA